MRLPAASLALVLAMTASAHAATLSVTSGNQGFVSDFKIEFDDSNGDGSLDYNEITGFSGVSQFSDPGIPAFLSVVIGIPNFAPYSTAGSNDSCICMPNAWSFANTPSGEDFAEFDASLFTYQISGVGVAPIPLPASALLLGTAGAGLLALRRRRRQA